jgi:hypothetical protein
MAAASISTQSIHMSLTGTTLLQHRAGPQAIAYSLCVLQPPQQLRNWDNQQQQTVVCSVSYVHQPAKQHVTIYRCVVDCDSPKSCRQAFVKPWKKRDSQAALVQAYGWDVTSAHTPKSTHIQTSSTLSRHTHHQHLTQTHAALVGWAETAQHCPLIGGS